MDGLIVTISPYLRRIRERLGSELLVLPSVTVLPTDSDGRILLVRNAETGDWMTIGGMVEPDEAPGVAAVREAREEAGVDVRPSPGVLVRFRVACQRET